MRETRRVLSPPKFHFLRRRAEERRQRILRSQRIARDMPLPVSRQERVRLDEMRIGLNDRIVIEKKGKWDARYIVVAYSRG